MGDLSLSELVQHRQQKTLPDYTPALAEQPVWAFAVAHGCVRVLSLTEDVINIPIDNIDYFQSDKAGESFTTIVLKSGVLLEVLTPPQELLLQLHEVEIMADICSCGADE